MKAIDDMKTVLHERLIDIVSKEFVSLNFEDVLTYSRDQNSPIIGSYVPDFVVMPKDAEEIQKVLRLANEHKVPIYPYAFGTNTTGTALAFKNGIVLDLRRLNQVLKIDVDCMAAIIEPGVSWGQLNKEARKKGLRPTFPQGPYSGGPIGNFLNGPVSPYASRFGPDRVISLEVVLANGEILRTGSAGYPTHEVLNPYFRYAYGPDLAGIFRGSLGTLGIITKAVYQLFPIGEKEEMISNGFADLESALSAMKRIERMDISKSAMITTREMLLKCTVPDVRVLIDKEESGRLKNNLPAWCLSIGISGTEKQTKIYRKLICEIMSDNRGSLLELKREDKGNYDDFIWGGGLKINRMLTPEGAIAWIITVSPGDILPKIRRITLNKIRELGILNPVTGEPLEPPVWCFPYDRCRNFYFEQDLSYDPLDVGSIVKIKKAYSQLNREIQKLGGTALVAVPSITKTLMPSYSGVLANIKRILDPNGIMSPGL